MGFSTRSRSEIWWAGLAALGMALSGCKLEGKFERWLLTRHYPREAYCQGGPCLDFTSARRNLLDDARRAVMRHEGPCFLKTEGQCEEGGTYLLTSDGYQHTTRYYDETGVFLAAQGGGDDGQVWIYGSPPSCTHRTEHNACRDPMDGGPPPPIRPGEIIEMPPTPAP